MIQLFKVISFVSVCLHASSIFASNPNKFFTKEEMTEARRLGASSRTMEQFFAENPKKMWMSMTDHSYQYNSQRQQSVTHEQAVIVQAERRNLFGCDILGELAIFPPTDESLAAIYKSVGPGFNDNFGTPYNCYITFYGLTENKFLVLDFIEVGYEQGGKGFASVATDAFIKFALTHTDAQYILCDARSQVYREIVSKKFKFKLERDDPLWKHFKKGVNQPYILNLEQIRQESVSQDAAVKDVKDDGLAAIH